MILKFYNPILFYTIYNHKKHYNLWQDLRSELNPASNTCLDHLFLSSTSYVTKQTSEGMLKETVILAEMF